MANIPLLLVAVVMAVPGCDIADPETDPEIEPMTVAVYIVAGQSNALGNASTSDLTDTSLLAAFPDVQIAEQLECPADDGAGACSTVSAWASLDDRSGEMGVQLSMGRRLHSRLFPLGPVRVLTIATSGSSLAGDWAPTATTGKVLYSRMLAFVAARGAQIGQTWKLSGMAWIQGEADANSANQTAAYESNLTTFLGLVRRDLGTPTLPIAIVRLHANVDRPAAQVATIRAAQARVVAAHHLLRLVNVDDLALRADNLHFSADAYATLGYRLANALADVVLYRRSALDWTVSDAYARGRK